MKENSLDFASISVLLLDDLRGSLTSHIRVFIFSLLQVAELLKALQVELLALLDEKIREPSLDLTHHAIGNKVISTIVHIISQ